MIHVSSYEAVIKTHCEEELRINFKALLGAICEHPDITLIFLEEFNIKAQELSKKLEELKNGKNDSSD